MRFLFSLVVILSSFAVFAMDNLDDDNRRQDATLRVQNRGFLPDVVTSCAPHSPDFYDNLDDFWNSLSHQYDVMNGFILASAACWAVNCPLQGIVFGLAGLNLLSRGRFWTEEEVDDLLDDVRSPLPDVVTSCNPPSDFYRDRDNFRDSVSHQYDVMNGFIFISAACWALNCPLQGIAFGMAGLIILSISRLWTEEEMDDLLGDTE